MGKVIDCLFLHPVRREQKERKEKLTHLIMPMGIFALASILEENGYEVLIVHTGLEEMLNNGFSVEAFLRKHDINLIAIDLHWYTHSYDAIRLAEVSKKTLECPVILGGFTATFFDIEIMNAFPFVDMIIRGEAEIPLLKLMNTISSSRDLSHVPNLTYRKDGKIVRTPISYVADQETINKLNFTAVKNLIHWQEYIKIIGQNSRIDEPTFLRRWWLAIGRGCSFNCAYCGGSFRSQRLICNRPRPIFRSPNRLVEDVVRLQDLGIRQIYIDFDPRPGDRRNYYTFFEGIRREGVDVGCEFLPWAPPDDAFIEAFGKTFDPYFSIITLSPESGAEHIRKINRTYFYTNDVLLSTIGALEKNGIYTQIYFTVGLSKETPSDFQQTIRLAQSIKAMFSNIIGPWCQVVAIDPASPRYLDPKRYGVILYRKSFMDFYQFARDLALGKRVRHPYGYRTASMSENQMAILEREFVRRLMPKASQTLVR